MASKSEQPLAPADPVFRDPRLRRFVTQTIGSPLKLRVLVELAAAQPQRRSLEALTARLGANSTSLAQALHALIRNGLISQSFRDGEMWYALAPSPAGRELTTRVYRVWRERPEAVLAELGDV